jgi:2-keto-4-pentenoate hydratase/2-oxohepta-3-ene-1,7-dioic acid hydratase in catechol pathway
MDIPLPGDVPSSDLSTRLITSWTAIRSSLERALPQRKPVGSLSGLKLHAPVPHPGKIMCMAANYRENTEYDALPPAGFVVPPQAILDPGGTVELPAVDFTICHHEAELVIVIGARARNIDPARALDYVFGYTCGVDISARDSFPVAVFALTKSWDTFKPIGPAVVTADEIPDPQDLWVRLTVNGEVRQDFNTSDMGQPVGEIVHWWSNFTTLMPGDLIFTGTNHQGVGALQDQDAVAMTIEKIGTLTVDVSDPLKRTWKRGIDEEAGTLVRERVREGIVAAHVSEDTR